ncbi:hypothetical protein WJX73_005322 [Symbiochloris irregularis]|uniref:Protein kinase domain-containing protein n=1 Tax=Symbiochloris irregularis TaxID=706552 RepID=A0AAW1PMT8_9CHLO
MCPEPVSWLACTCKKGSWPESRQAGVRRRLLLWPAFTESNSAVFAEVSGFGGFETAEAKVKAQTYLARQTSGQLHHLAELLGAKICSAKQQPTRKEYARALTDHLADLPAKLVAQQADLATVMQSVRASAEAAELQPDGVEKLRKHVEDLLCEAHCAVAAEQGQPPTRRRRISFKVDVSSTEALSALASMSHRDRQYLIERDLDALGPFQLATRRELAAMYVNDGWPYAEGVIPNTTYSALLHCSAEIGDDWGASLADKRYLETFDDKELVIYTAPEVPGPLGAEKEVELIMNRNFWTIVGIVLERDPHNFQYRVHQPKSALLGRRPDARPQRFTELGGAFQLDRVRYTILYTDTLFWMAKWIPDLETPTDSAANAASNTALLSRKQASGQLLISPGVQLTDARQRPVACAAKLMRMAAADWAATSAPTTSPACKRRPVEGGGANIDVDLSAPYVWSDYRWHAVETCSEAGVDSTWRWCWFGYELGTGSTGSVHLGALGQSAQAYTQVAVKAALLRWPESVYFPAPWGRTPKDRLLSEIALLQGPLKPLQGSIVPQVLATGMIGDQLPFYAMEVLEPIQSYVHSREERLQMVQGLSAIHAMGVIHNDVHTDYSVFVGLLVTSAQCTFGSFRI